MTTRTLTIHMPLRTISGANAREHFRVRAKRVADERRTTAFVCGPQLRGLPIPELVTFVRLSPRLIDCDNLTSSMKAIRDEVAELLGTHDGPTGPVRWAYDQRKSKTFGVEIVVTLKADA
jgi:hypothetical protein